MSESKWYVGQVVVVSGRYGGRIQTKISKVARKYVYTDATGNTPFSIATGREERTVYTPAQLYTTEEWAKREERSDVLQRLREAGITFAGYGSPPFPTATLQRLWDALQVEESGDG